MIKRIPFILLVVASSACAESAATEGHIAATVVDTATIGDNGTVRTPERVAMDCRRTPDETICNF